MRLYPLFLSIFISLIFFLPSYAKEQINSFDVDISILKDGSLRVEENIEYQFIDVYRHGIYRKIPYKYKKGKNNYNLRVDVGSVTDFSGNEYPTKVSKTDDYINIKIGDPTKKITGTHGYRIEYFVNRAILFLDDHDELYWNVTGTEWRIPIENASAKVHHNNVSSEDIKAKCFTGFYGSTGENCSYSISQNSIDFRTDKALWSRGGLTIVTGFSKGVISEPSELKKMIWFLSDNSIYGLPFLTLFGLVFLWKKSGRDPGNDKPVAVRYEPPEGITPAEAGALYDERADMIDLTSTVVDLAVRGYLRIEEIETTRFLFLSDRDYKLVKLRYETYEAELKAHEKRVLNGIFSGDKTEVMVSELKNEFYSELEGIKDSIYSELVSNRYFLSSPDRVRNMYKYVGMAIIFLGLLFLSGMVTKLVVAISGLIVVIFSRYMPKKTKRGVSINHHLLGFREFIERAEKDRIKKFADEDPKVFDRILPFALVFGLEEKWAEAFSNVFTEPPDWYSSDRYGATFHPHIFINDLGRSISIMNKCFYSSPENSSGGRFISMGGGFGSGGFSGGGFGGGGGGSW